MGYKLSNKKFAPRSDGVDYNDVAPGLYPDESVVELDTGELVAVSVEETYRETDHSICLRGYARLIRGDGSTRLTPQGIDGSPGKHVETVLCCAASVEDCEQFGIDRLRGEVLRLMLGDAPTMVPIEQTGAAPLSAEQIESGLKALRADGASPDATMWHDPDATERPLLRIPADQLQSGQIATAIAALAALETRPRPAALLKGA